MIHRFTFSISLLLLSSLYATSQERAKFFALEAGTNFIATERVEKNYIRGDTPDFYNYNAFSRRIGSEMYNAYIGAKVEVRSLNDIFGFISGLRFTRLTSSIRKNGSPDYLFFLLRQTGTTTEYLTVESITQNSDYLGIPMEVRFFPYKRKDFRLYFVAGTEVSYRVHTKTKTVFDNPAMGIYQSDVAEVVGKPSRWYGLLYSRIGFILGKDSQRVGLGVTAPLLIMNTVSSLTQGISGGGVHIQVQIPF